MTIAREKRGMLGNPALAITWSAELSVGSDVIDGQHERLIELFNELVAIQARAITHEELQPILDDLLDNTRSSSCYSW